MIEQNWTKKILLKYIAFQIPSFLILCVILLALNNWYKIGYLVISIVLVLWVIKDGLMFSCVWKSYETRTHLVNWESKVINRKAEVIEDLKPDGYVRLNGELWKARCSESSYIAKGERVSVEAIQNKLLIVTKSDK